MQWEHLMKLPKGAEADPDSFAGLEPIITISETVKPRLIMTATYPNGENALWHLSCHSGTGKFQRHARYRFADGTKKVYPPTPWFGVDETVFAAWKEEQIASFRAMAAELDGVVVVLEFKPDDSLDRIVKTFQTSEIFDMLITDKKNKKAKKVA